MAFVGGLFFLELLHNGCLSVFVCTTFQDVGVCQDDLYAVLQSWGRRHFVLGVPDTRYCVEEFGIDFSLKKRLPGVRNTCWSGYRN